jgi:hypothetical protein
MGYDEPKFIGVDELEPAAPLALIGQVMTGSGAVVTSTYTGVNDIRVPAACAMVGGFVIVDTAGQGGQYVCQIQSGTKVVSTATLGTAGAVALFALDTSSSVVAAGGAFNVSILGTGTASATQNSPALRVGINVRYQLV